jgi:hypothetical protein
VVDQKFKNWYAIIHIKFGKQRKHIVIKNGDGKEKIPLVHDQNWQWKNLWDVIWQQWKNYKRTKFGNAQDMRRIHVSSSSLMHLCDRNKNVALKNINTRSREFYFEFIRHIHVSSSSLVHLREERKMLH